MVLYYKDVHVHALDVYLVLHQNQGWKFVLSKILFKSHGVLYGFALTCQATFPLLLFYDLVTTFYVCSVFFFIIVITSYENERAGRLTGYLVVCSILRGFTFVPFFLLVPGRATIFNCATPWTYVHCYLGQNGLVYHNMLSNDTLGIYYCIIYLIFIYYPYAILGIYHCTRSLSIWFVIQTNVTILLLSFQYFLLNFRSSECLSVRTRIGASFKKPTTQKNGDVNTRIIRNFATFIIVL